MVLHCFCMDRSRGGVRRQVCLNIAFLPRVCLSDCLLLWRYVLHRYSPAGNIINSGQFARNVNPLNSTSGGSGGGGGGGVTVLATTVFAGSFKTSSSTSPSGSSACWASPSGVYRLCIRTSGRAVSWHSVERPVNTLCTCLCVYLARPVCQGVCWDARNKCVVAVEARCTVDLGSHHPCAVCAPDGVQVPHPSTTSLPAPHQCNQNKLATGLA